MDETLPGMDRKMVEDDGVVLRICGQDVRVDFCNPGHWNNGMGRASIKDGVITINSTMREDIQHSTLIHEILHFIADTNGLMECKMNEEHTISVVACALHACMRDNHIFKEMCDFGKMKA